MSFNDWAPVRFCRWLARVLRKEKVLITYTVTGDRFRETMTYARISEKQAYGMGYLKGKKMKDELKFLPFKIFVRFQSDESPGEAFALVDKEIVINHETAGTLYDYFRSNAVEDFIKGMTTKKPMAAIDQKKLLMVIAIAAGAAAGLYLLLT